VPIGYDTSEVQTMQCTYTTLREDRTMLLKHFILSDVNILLL